MSWLFLCSSLYVFLRLSFRDSLLVSSRSSSTVFPPLRAVSGKPSGSSALSCPGVRAGGWVGSGRGHLGSPEIPAIGVLPWLPLFPEGDSSTQSLVRPRLSHARPLPRHRWADATLCGPVFPLPSPANPPPTTLPLMILAPRPPRARPSKSRAHHMSLLSTDAVRSVSRIRLSSYRRSELDRAELHRSSPRMVCSWSALLPTFFLLYPQGPAPPRHPGLFLLPSRRPTPESTLVYPPLHWKVAPFSEPACPNTLFFPPHDIGLWSITYQELALYPPFPPSSGTPV
jgi:hypothetical protein